MLDRAVCPGPLLSKQLGATLRAELGAFGLSTAGGTDASGRPFDLGAAFGAELGAMGFVATFGAGIHSGLCHRAATLGAELGAGWRYRAVLGTARQVGGGLPGRLTGPLYGISQPQGTGKALQDGTCLLGLGLGDLGAARAVLVAVAALLVKV